jgi:hypothetical protein
MMLESQEGIRWLIESRCSAPEEQNVYSTIWSFASRAPWERNKRNVPLLQSA